MFKKSAERVEFLILFILALALVFLASPALVSAATIQQTDNSSSVLTDAFRQALNATMAAGNPASKTTELSGTISSITFRVDPDLANDAWRIGLYRTAGNCTGGWSVQERESDFTNFSGTAEQNVTYSFGEYTFNPAECYMIQIATRNSGGYVKDEDIRIGSGNLWTWGDAWTSDFGASVEDAYFITNATLADIDSISISFPVSTSTPIQEFTDWIVSYTLATSTTATSTDFYIKQVYVGATSTAVTTLAGGSSYPPDIAPSPETISKPFALGLGTWYAQAQLRYFRDVYDQYGTLVATSSVISFPIGWGFGASGSWATPTSTATSSEWTMTCDPDSGAFAYSLCFLAQALFVPSSGATAQFQGIGDLVSSKPPLGYFQQVKTVLSGLAETTSTFALADLSSMSTALTTPIKTAIQVILWFLFGFWILNRIRHFEL